MSCGLDNVIGNCPIFVNFCSKVWSSEIKSVTSRREIKKIKQYLKKQLKNEEVQL